jgi:hypothetical protein
MCATPKLAGPSHSFRLWVLKTSSACQFVELVAFRLPASSGHDQPYINVAQVPSHRLSKPNCDAGRDHRASSSTDRVAANSKDKAPGGRYVASQGAVSDVFDATHGVRL